VADGAGAGGPAGAGVGFVDTDDEDREHALKAAMVNKQNFTDDVIGYLCGSVKSMRCMRSISAL
jgi:hypothetical protein